MQKKHNLGTYNEQSYSRYRKAVTVWSKVVICRKARREDRELPDPSTAALSEGKEYKQNHNTIVPAPLGIEPNMTCIETQQTTHNQQASGPRTGTLREIIPWVSNQYCRAQGNFKNLRLMALPKNTNKTTTPKLYQRQTPLGIEPNMICIETQQTKAGNTYTPHSHTCTPPRQIHVHPPFAEFNVSV
jgi:hypothetical protein